jgi:hypothetical protein
MENKKVLVVASTVKNHIKSKKMKTSSDTIAALSNNIYEILDNAVARAKANRRSIIRPQDL